MYKHWLPWLPKCVMWLILCAVRWKHSDNTRRSPNAVLMLGQRPRRWPSIKPDMGERLVLSGSRAPSIYKISLLRPGWITTYCYHSISNPLNTGVLLHNYTSFVVARKQCQRQMSRNYRYFLTSIRFRTHSLLISMVAEIIAMFFKRHPHWTG